MLLKTSFLLSILAVAAAQGGAGAAQGVGATGGSGGNASPSAAAADPASATGAADSPQPTDSAVAAASATEVTTAAAAATSSAACTFCTVPAGYTEEQVPPPLHVEDDFTPEWRDAHRKAKDYLTDWSIEDKVNLATGAGWMIGRCVGNIPPLPQHNWTGLCLQDSPLGVRFADLVSVFPAAINAAATFDKGLLYKRGYAMGEEFKGKGVNVALGPMMNMGRVAAGGRNWEGFGADPYLTGWGAHQTIKGLQDAGVQACAKHFVGNEQERNRTTSSSNIDDRTMREIYSHPFLRSVQADVASVMCSYNLLNGSWACQNQKVLNGILKTDFGFAGYVMSDWDATHSGVNAANNGLDMDMPGDIGFSGGKYRYFGPNLTEAVNNQSVSQERLDDMAQRVLAAWFLVDQNDYPETNFDSWQAGGVNNSHVNVQDDHYKLIRKIGAASTVLLKNNGVLPLQAPKTIALIGEDMGPSSRGPNGYPDHGGDEGTLAVGWGSGTSNFPYLIDPLEAIQTRARKDGTGVAWWLRNWDLDGIASTVVNSEVAIVGINSDSGEQYITVDGNIGDRNNLTAWGNGDNVVLETAKNHNNTIVVVHSVGPIDMEAWIDHPNITAVLWAGLPGQETGNSLVQVLYGDYNPSGRLPYTIAKHIEDYPAVIDYVNTDVPPETDVNYTEGLNIDYRHFLTNNIEPRYPFGFGLSYSTFEYGDLKLKSYDAPMKRHGGDDNEDCDNGDDDKHGHGHDGHGHGHGHHGHGHGHKERKVGRFLDHELQSARWQITFTVTNTGDVDGFDVPQLYLAYPPESGEPPRVFRDFERVWLDAGATEKVMFELSNYDVSVWDVVKQDWVVPDGTFTAIVAHNAMDTDNILSTEWSPRDDLRQYAGWE